MPKSFLAIVICWFVAAVSPVAAQIHGVTVTLPDALEWTLAHEASDGPQYIREWVPAGSTLETTRWLIVEQKLVLGQRMSAKAFLKMIMTLASDVCTDVKVNGPKVKKLGGQKTAWGRIMCAQQAGKDYGTFSDQRVLVDGTTAYVITSELRVPPTEVAGALPFSSQEEVQEFWDKTQISARVVQENVSLSPKPKTRQDQ